jgi:hypothetical protein
MGFIGVLGECVHLFAIVLMCDRVTHAQTGSEDPGVAGGNLFQVIERMKMKG